MDTTEYLAATNAAAVVSKLIGKPYSSSSIGYHEARGHLPAMRVQDGRGRGTRLYRHADVVRLAETLVRAQGQRAR